MITYILVVVMFACLLFGMPIAFSLGIPGVIYLLVEGIPLKMVAGKMFTGVDSFVLVAVPMFIVAGNLMNKSGISKRLIAFSLALVGALPGGLAMVNVISSMFFAGVTGAAAADTAVMGSVLIPAMRKEGYEDGFSAALTAVSSTVGPIIPPSILFVIYGMSANVSITSLFLAGIIPGILIGISLMITIFIIAKKKKYPSADKLSFKKIGVEFKNSICSLILPPLIVAGLAFGIMTPTEISILAVVLSFILGMFIYKELKWTDIPEILTDSAILSGALTLIIATNNILLYAISLEQVGDKIGAGLFAITQNKIFILLIINIVLLIFGAVIDTLPIMLMFIPVLKPIFLQLGIDPVHAGVFIVLNLVIGLSTPPVGTCLFVSSSIAKTNIETVSKYLPPFMFAMIVVLLLVTFYPPITLWVPSLFM